MHVADFVAKPARTSQLLEVVRAVASGAGLDTVRVATTKEEAAGRPLHILLAEDVPVNQIVAEGLLELLGHKVTIANNGTEAVEAVKSQAFDIVFMDIEMPDMDGLQATSLIRHYEKNAGTRVPIVAMSAHAMMGFQERCQQAGMDGYVSKPIVPEEIKRILGSVPQACCSPVSA